MRYLNPTQHNMQAFPTNQQLTTHQTAVILSFLGIDVLSAGDHIDPTSL